MISLLFALGLGGAWAASELSKNEVKSKHIGKGQVKAKDLGKNAVSSPKVANGSLLDEDFAPGQLPAGPPGEQGEPGERGAQGIPGPTEGFGGDSFPGNLPSEQVVDSDSFTTTRAGRLFLAKPISVARVDCSVGDYRIWLELRTDGVDTRVPGSVVDQIGDNVTLYGLQLIGVTSASVPAGEHEVLARTDCPSGTAQNATFSSLSGVNAVVLGE